MILPPKERYCLLQDNYFSEFPTTGSHMETERGFLLIGKPRYWKGVVPFLQCSLSANNCIFTSKQLIPTKKLFDKLIFNPETIWEHLSLRIRFNVTISCQFVEVNKTVSSSNWRCVTHSPPYELRILWSNPCLLPSLKELPRTSATMVNKKGDNGSPVLDLEGWNILDGIPFITLRMM